jgi:hypothetical protein
MPYSFKGENNELRWHLELHAKGKGYLIWNDSVPLSASPSTVGDVNPYR